MNQPQLHRGGQQFAITGFAGAGKTRLVARLSAATGLPALMIDDAGGDWRLFRWRAHHHPGPVLLESVALPPWPVALLIYCRCDEEVRQARLKRRGARRSTPSPAYDFSQQADLVVDTTTTPVLQPILRTMWTAMRVAA